MHQHRVLQLRYKCRTLACISQTCAVKASVVQGWLRAPFLPTLRDVLLPPTAAAAVLLAVPAAALRLMLVTAARAGIPHAAVAAAGKYAWLAEVCTPRPCVGCLRVCRLHPLLNESQRPVMHQPERTSWGGRASLRGRLHALNGKAFRGGQHACSC